MRMRLKGDPSPPPLLLLSPTPPTPPQHRQMDGAGHTAISFRLDNLIRSLAAPSARTNCFTSNCSPDERWSAAARMLRGVVEGGGREGVDGTWAGTLINLQGLTYYGSPSPLKYGRHAGRPLLPHTSSSRLAGVYWHWRPRCRPTSAWWPSEIGF